MNRVMRFEVLRTRRRHLLSFLTLVFLLSGSLFTQCLLEQRSQGRIAKLEQLRLLPRGEILRPALLGYHQLGADLLWLRVVQVLGDRVVRDKDYEWLYHALDVITTVDPKYVYAYEAGGVVLAELAWRVDLSNRLLEKGLAPNPSAWQIPFRLGFNHFFHLGDHSRAAEYMAQAARIPGLFPIGPPHYTARLASRLYVQGKNPEVALEFLEAMLEQTTDELVREKLQRRIRRVSLERDLQMLDRQILQYANSKGKRPVSLMELVSAGLLPGIPLEPYGGVYLYDPKTGKVMSSTHDERMGVYVPADSLATRGDIE
jgi:tetratricopeptide (TPR) repeat protein